MGIRTSRSFRLAPGTLERLEQRARESRSTVTALVERYIDEGLAQQDHPGVVFRDGPVGRRASMAGSGLDVWEIVATVQDNHGSSAEAAAYLDVAEGLVRDALRYYADHRAEIDAWITQNDRIYEEEERRQHRVAEAFE